MATSGTVGTTVIDTAKVIDHAVRRCGLMPSTLTPEQLDTCLSNLYLLLVGFANRGINLWCIDRELVALQPNKANYQLSVGTLDILDVSYRTVTSLSHTDTQTGSSYSGDFGADIAVPVKMLGIYYNATRERDLTFEVSNDGVTYAPVADFGKFIGYAGQWSWHEIDPAYSTRYFRITDSTEGIDSLNFAQVRVASTMHEIPLSPMNRDDYFAMPNKRQPGQPNQYFFEKTVQPSLNLYPEPNSSVGHLVVRRHRQVQDVGTMQDTLEIPSRWYDPTIWSLAKVLAYELPGVEKERRIEIAAFAAVVVKEAEDAESDGAPFFLRPNISGYTK